MDLPSEIDLNGIWEIDGAQVQITHSGSTVEADFLSGAACFDGQVRPWFIRDGELQVVVPTEVSLSGKMWVCSGSPDLVLECAGRLSSAYETTFRNATVQPDRISGTRVTQGVLNCQPNAAFNGSRDFLVTRNRCTVEEAEVALWESLLGDLNSYVTRDLHVFAAAHLAAQNRWGESYNGPSLSGPTHLLVDAWPWVAVDPLAPSEDFFEALHQALVVNPDTWVNARLMAEAMAILGDDGSNPLPEAAPMIEQMNLVEAALPAAQALIDDLRNARQRLNACRQPLPSAQR